MHPPNGAEPQQESAADQEALPKLRGLICVGDNVLYDATLWRRWLWQLLGHFGVTGEYAEFFRPWDEQFAPDVCTGRRDYTEAFGAFLLQQGLRHADIDELEAANAAKRRELAQSIRLLPGVAATLQSLIAAGVRVCVVNNCDDLRNPLARRLTSAGLHLPSQCVISSLQVEAALPAPAMFATALAALDMSPASVMFVGQVNSHVQAAAALGLVARVINTDDAGGEIPRLARFEDLAPEFAKALPDGHSHPPACGLRIFQVD